MNDKAREKAAETYLHAKQLLMALQAEGAIRFDDGWVAVLQELAEAIKIIQETPAIELREAVLPLRKSWRKPPVRNAGVISNG